MLKIVYNYLFGLDSRPHTGPVIRSSDGKETSFRLATKHWLEEGKLVVVSAGKTSKVFHRCKDFSEAQEVVFVDLKKWDYLLLDKNQDLFLSKFPVCRCGEIPGSITDREFITLS